MTVYEIKKYSISYSVSTNNLTISVFLYDETDAVRGIFAFTSHVPNTSLETARVAGLPVTRAWLSSDRFTDFYTMLREDKPLRLMDQFQIDRGNFILVTGELEPVGEEGH